MDRLSRVVAALLLSVTLSGCVSFSNRGGLSDKLLDDYWSQADSKDHRALRAFGIQGALLRIGLTNSGTLRQKQTVAFKNWQSTTAFRDVLSCFTDLRTTEKDFFDAVRIDQTIRDYWKDCPYYDTRMRTYEDSLLVLAQAAFAFEEESALLKHILAGGSDVVGTILAIGQAAIKAGRVVLPLYRDMIELEVLVWKDQDPSLAALYASGHDDLAAWKQRLRELKSTGAAPPIRPNHVYYISDMIADACRDTGLDEIKTRCSQDLPFLPGFEKRLAPMQAALDAANGKTVLRRSHAADQIGKNAVRTQEIFTSR
jgi:hypothetical protein